MKQIIALSFFLLCSVSVVGQRQKRTDKYHRRNGRREMVMKRKNNRRDHTVPDRGKRMDKATMDSLEAVRTARRLEVDDSKVADFTTLYRDYMAKKRELKKRNDEVTEVKSSDFDDSRAEKMMTDLFDSKEAMVKNDREFYKKFQKVLSPAQASTLFSDKVHRLMSQKKASERAKTSDNKPKAVGKPVRGKEQTGRRMNKRDMTRMRNGRMRMGNGRMKTAAANKSQAGTTKK